MISLRLPGHLFYGVLLLAPSLVAATSRPARWPDPVVSYRLQASLDARTHTVYGSEQVTWVNRSPDAIPTLQLHLYMNAFKNENSTFFRESGGKLRSDKSDRQEWGWIDLKSFRLSDGRDLMPAVKFIQPDDGNRDDATVVEVRLPQPLAPGATLVFDVAFETKLPHVFARSGFHGTFHLVGQWFPKLGVWESAGTRYATSGAWNCHQYHATSEFYADFGDYRAELTVPSEYVVGATGELRNQRIKTPGTKTYTFEQNSVIDFAWTAQPGYLQRERTFDSRLAVSPNEVRRLAALHGIPPEEVELSDVKMIVLLQPEHAEQEERHFRALTAALKWFGLWYGRYPYKTITVVDPPYGAGGAGGMEYPTFITAGTSWKAPEDYHGLEDVVVHEFGHQFWMQLVATNEFEESWLDEGFNTYSTTQIMDKVFGAQRLPLSWFGFNFAHWLRLPDLTPWGLNRAEYLLDPVADDLVRRAWEYETPLSYEVNSYARAGATLKTLENLVGRGRMDRLMRIYHQRYRFQHPDSRDFQRVASEVSGQDLGWFFDQFVFGNRKLDYRVGEVTSDAVTTALGVFGDGKQRTTVDQKAAEQREHAPGAKTMYRSQVTIERNGDAVAPVDILIRFEDHSVEKRRWDGRYRWARYEFTRASEVDQVIIDPEHRWLLDVDYTNNSWTAGEQMEALMRWGGNLLFWAQNTMIWVGSLI